MLCELPPSRPYPTDAYHLSSELSVKTPVYPDAQLEPSLLSLCIRSYQVRLCDQNVDLGITYLST